MTSNQNYLAVIKVVGIGGGGAVAIDVFLHGLQVLGHALQFLVALLEFLLETLLGAQRRAGLAHDAVGIHEADLGFGMGDLADADQSHCEH